MVKNELKYIQIEKYIRKQIKNKKLKHGDQIETEAELEKRFGFSRMTINKALNNLAAEGIISRTAGKGSFVKVTHIAKEVDVRPSSFSEDMISIGMNPGSKLLSYELIRADTVPHIKEKLEIQENIFLHFFVRLRTGDGNPIAISYNYVSTDILPSLNIKSLDNSLYEYLESINCPVIKSQSKFQAVLPTDEQKELLEIENVPLFRTSSLDIVLQNNEENILGFFDTFYNGNIYSYTTK